VLDELQQTPADALTDKRTFAGDLPLLGIGCGAESDAAVSGSPFTVGRFGL